MDYPSRIQYNALAGSHPPEVPHAGPEFIDPLYAASNGASLRSGPPATWRDNVRSYWQDLLQATGALPTGQDLTYDQNRLVSGLVGSGRQMSGSGGVPAHGGALDSLMMLVAPQATLGRAMAVQAGTQNRPFAKLPILND